MSKVEYSLKKGVLFRFEPYIDSGTVFIYDSASMQIYDGNKALYDLLCLTKENSDLDSLRLQLSMLYPDADYKQICDGTKSMLNYLVDIGVVKEEAIDGEY